jgi:lipopolysaccharide transport system permease protein
VSAEVVPEPEVLRSRIHTALRRLASEHSAVHIGLHLGLLLRTTRTELRARYAGSLLGFGWVFIAPLLVLGMYAAVYLVILRVGRPPDLASGFDYTLYMFAGLAPFFMLAEALSLSVGSVVGNRAALSNVVFPIDLAPVKSVLTAQGPMVVGTILLLVGTTASGVLSWTVVFLPLIWLLNVLMLMGTAWFLSLLNIVFRDLQNLLAAVLLMLLIVSPIVYTPSIVPGSLEFLIALNPFAYFVISYQRIWILGEPPTATQLVVMTSLALLAFGLGGRFFARAKRALVDYV